MRVGKANGSDWLRLTDAAALLGVSHNTLRAWSDDGRVRCYRSPGGHRRYRRRDLDALVGETAATGTASDRGRDPGAADPRQDPALDALAVVATRGSRTTSCCIAVQESDETLRILAVHGDADCPPPGTSVPLASLPAEAEVVHGRRRLHLPDVARTRLLARATADAYCRRGFLGLLALPVELHGGRAGVLVLGDSRGPHAFGLEAMTFAESMARHAEVLVSDAPGDESAGRPGADGAPFKDAIAESSHRDATTGPHGLQAVAQAAVAMLDGRRELSFCNVHVTSRGRARAVATSGDTPLAEWDQGDLYATAEAGGEVVLVRRDDPHLTPAARVSFFDAREVTALVLVPVLRYGETVALIEAGGLDPARLWAAAPALKGAALLLSAALQSGEEEASVRGRQRDLAVLRDVWQQDTSRLGTEQVLRELVERLALATMVPIVEIYAVEGDTARSLVSYDGGRWDAAWEDVILRLERYPTSRRAVETGEPVLIGGLDDAKLQPEGRFSMERWGYQSHLSIPLSAGGRTLGLLELYDYVPHDFTPELELARGVGRLAALTLDVEYRGEQVRTRNRIISELEAIARICAAAHDPETLVARVAESLRTALDAAACHIYRLTPRGILCIAGHDRTGRDDEAIGNVGDLGGFPTAVHALNARDVVAVSSPHDERLSHAERSSYRAGGWTSEVCVPLVLQDDISGFIDIVDTRSRAFTEYADFLRSVASTLAVALEAGRLGEEIAHLTGDLTSIAALGVLRLETEAGGEALEILASEVRLHVGAADCDVFALHDDGLRCLVSVDQQGRDDTVGTAPLDIDRYPATAQAVRSGEMVVIPDLHDPRLSDQERADMLSWGFRSEACVPLVAEGRVCGILDVFDAAPRDYAADREYLQAAARIAAAFVAVALARDGSGGHDTPAGAFGRTRAGRRHGGS